jgi:hypothetical protein
MKSIEDRGPPSVPIFKGESIAIVAQMAVGRRTRSKVRIRVVGASSMGWIEAAEGWGAEVEDVVVDIPDHFKDIRRKVSLTPTTTPQDGLRLLPLGPWDGCLFATIATASETQLVTALFKRWRPAIAILAIHSSVSRIDTIGMLPAGLPLFYQKKMMTCRHSSIGGVSTSLWRFIHYTRWGGVISYPSSLMTSDNLPRFLQTALSDTLGGVRGATFEPRSGLDQSPLAIGLLSSPTPELTIPVYSGEGLAPDLFCLPPRERHFWVSAQSVFSTKPVLRQVKTAELMAIWDYEGKLESRGWS